MINLLPLGAQFCSRPIGNPLSRLLNFPIHQVHLQHRHNSFAEKKKILFIWGQEARKKTTTKSRRQFEHKNIYPYAINEAELSCKRNHSRFTCTSKIINMIHAQTKTILNHARIILNREQNVGRSSSLAAIDRYSLARIASANVIASCKTPVAITSAVG